jgi:hypothetical protein
MKAFDLNVANPEALARVLREAAQAFNESRGELQAAWQDDSAGRVWAELARVLERAADQSDKACKKYFR